MIVIENASEILTIPHGYNKPKKGNEMRDLGIIKNSNIWIDRGKIIKITKELPDKIEEKIDASGKIVMPAFVDPHTHLVFSGIRDFELSLKMQGKSYLEIQNAGGGIYYTVDKTRNASEEELYEESSKRLEYMVKHGTLGAEAKSGYGIDIENEIKMLKVIKRLSENYSIEISPTFLLHIIPKNMEEKEYVEYISDNIEKIKDYAKNVDVFCDKGAFSKESTELFLKKAKEQGFKLKMHADELEYIGCSSLIKKFDFISMDHLLKTPDEIINEMSKKNTVAVLLPGTPFTLFQESFSDARKFIKNNVAVAIGTDLNPNCYTENMQEIISLSIYRMRMTVEEAIVASTYNAAFASGLQDKLGSIEVGKDANLIIMDAKSYTEIGYHFGVNLVTEIIKKGKVIS
ncbi:MAG: imidazolonepropionase [Thermoplasmata archaeon]|nr:imidazolonepropionase [Thermoplasmata archaeon]